MTYQEQPKRKENIRAIVDYFESGIKNEAITIGIELEHTLVKSNGEPVCYDDEHGQKWLLEQLSPKYDKRMQGLDGSLIGLARKGSSITLEPAAQVELSAGPFSSLSEAKACLDAFEDELEEALKGCDIDVLTPGYHPTRRAMELELIPKKRYQIMNEYLGAISMFGICMMRGSAATQVTIDYTSVDDCLRKMRLANACVPVFSLICDNTPVFEATPRPHELMRTKIWEKCDPDRCMTVPGIMDAGFSLEQYAEYILDTPAMVAIENGEHVYSSRPIGELFANKTMGRADVEHALSVFFTDVRLKTYIEIRPADAMPPECVIAYAALVKGLFYNEQSLDALDSLFEGVTAEDIMEAKSSLMADGYNGYVYHHPVSEIADELIAIATAGLCESDAQLLEPLAKLVAARKTLAEIALKG